MTVEAQDRAAWVDRAVMESTLNLVLNQGHEMTERRRRQDLEELAASDIGRAVLADRIDRMTATVKMLEEYLVPGEAE